MEGPTLSDTVRKVDRALARLEELQCILVNRNHGNVKRAPKSRIAEGGGGDWRRWSAPAPMVHRAVEEVVEGAQDMAVQKRQPRKAATPSLAANRPPRSFNGPGGKIEMPPPSPPSSAGSTTNNCAGVSKVRLLSQDRVLPRSQARKNLHPQPSVQRPLRQSAVAPSAPLVAHRQPTPKPAPPRSKLPRTFQVDACPQPNRPWRLSTPLSSTTSSNNLATSGSSTASTIAHHRSPLRPLHNPRSLHRYDTSSAKSTPLHPNVPSPKLRNNFLLSPSPPPKQLPPPPKKLQPTVNGFLSETFQPAERPVLSPSPSPIRQNAVSQTLPDKENETPSVPRSLQLPLPPATEATTIPPPAAKGKPPWFTRRFSLPISPSTKSTRAALSLLANQHAGSPQKPLPSLITRLPARRKAMNSQQHQAQLLVRETPVIDTPTLDAPLPLPPAMCATRRVQKEGEEEDSLQQPRHRRSRSCPRQRLLSNAGLDDSLNGENTAQQCELDFDRQQAHRYCSCIQGKGTSCGGGMQLPTSCFRKGEKSGGGCTITKLLGCGGSGGGCGALRRSWSFSCLHNASNPAGSYLLKFKGFMQTRSKRSQVYRVDSFSPRVGSNQKMLYTV